MTTRQTLNRPKGMNAIAQTLPAVLVAVLALVLLIAGARMGLAGVASYSAEAFVGSWEKAGGEPGARAWQVAHSAAQRANRLYPVANGEYLDRLGRVYSWQQVNKPYANPAAQNAWRAALNAYSAATAARPTWPYTWERLAHTKLYLQEFDEPFNQALAQAFRRGPWRIGVNRELANIGFNAWPRLTPKQRQATLEAARRSVANGRREATRILKIAETSGRLNELCNSLSTELITTRRLTACT